MIEIDEIIALGEVELTSTDEEKFKYFGLIRQIIEELQAMKKGKRRRFSDGIDKFMLDGNGFEGASKFWREFYKYWDTHG